MFYNAIHARGREDGKGVVLAHDFSDLPGHPAQPLVELWFEVRNNPDIGKTYSTLHRVLDNSVTERLEMRHPDEAAKEQERLRTGEAERAEAHKKASVLEVRRAMAARGLSVEDIAGAESETAPAHKMPAAPPVPAQREEAEEEPSAPHADTHRTSRLKKSAS